MSYKRRTAIKKIEPLKTEKDYGETYKKKFDSAINLEKIYFVNEKYERLIVTGNDVREGGEPTRYLGVLKDIPRTGDYVISEDRKIRYRVLRWETVLNNSKTVPPKKFIVLRKEG